MAAFFRSVRSGFNRQPEMNNGQQRTNGLQNSSLTTHSPTMSGLSPSASLHSSTGPASEILSNTSEAQAATEQPKFFFREKFAKLGVKGNFMPLAAQPVHVDLADWLAHQTVENYRLVSTMAACIQEIDHNTQKPVCNSESCPKMSAGGVSYTWLDRNQAQVQVTAAQYISLVQRWMNGKVHDPKAFPMDTPNPSSNETSGTPTSEKAAGKEWIGREAGFPESFLSDCRTCFRQIFRIYAHLYHSHWVDPFWHLSTGSNSQGWTDLNSCFVHFCTVAKLYGLLSEKDAEPMQPLIDIWIENGSIPAEAAKETQKIVPPQ